MRGLVLSRKQDDHKDHASSATQASDDLDVVCNLQHRLEQTQQEVNSWKARCGNEQLLEEQVQTLKQDRSDILASVANATQELHSLRAPVNLDVNPKPIHQEIVAWEGKSPEALLANLRAAVALMKPLQHRFNTANKECQELRSQLANQEREHRDEVNEMTQEVRRSSDEVWLKDQEITRLKQKVEALESEVQEAKVVAKAHGTLSQVPTSPVAGIKKSISKDSPKSPSVREKLRKKRESETRFLQRFQGAQSHLQLEQGPQPRQHQDSVWRVSDDPVEWKIRLRGVNINSLSGLSDRDSCNVSALSWEGSSLANGPPLILEESKCQTEDVRQGFQHSLRKIFDKSPEKVRTKSSLKVNLSDSSNHPNDLLHPSTEEGMEEKKQSRDDSSQESLHVTLDYNKRSPSNVSFTTVQVRTYLQTLAGGPAVTFGPWLCLDWMFEEHDPVDINDYEKSRGPYVSNSKELFLSSTRRNDILKKRGFSDDDLLNATFPPLFLDDGNEIDYDAEMENILGELEEANNSLLEVPPTHSSKLIENVDPMEKHFVRGQLPTSFPTTQGTKHDFVTRKPFGASYHPRPQALFKDKDPIIDIFRIRPMRKDETLIPGSTVTSPPTEANDLARQELPKDDDVSSLETASLPTTVSSSEDLVNDDLVTEVSQSHSQNSQVAINSAGLAINESKAVTTGVSEDLATAMETRTSTPAESAILPYDESSKIETSTRQPQTPIARKGGIVRDNKAYKSDTDDRSSMEAKESYLVATTVAFKERTLHESETAQRYPAYATTVVLPDDFSIEAESVSSAISATVVLPDDFSIEAESVSSAILRQPVN